MDSDWLQGEYGHCFVNGIVYNHFRDFFVSRSFAMTSQLAAATPPAKRPKVEMDAETIYQRIQTGILERRLLPGAKLAEERLAEVTGASRMRIRQVLARLAHEQIVTLIPNRGAYVASPTVEEAREMFEARRLIEPPLAAKLSRQVT